MVGVTIIFLVVVLLLVAIVVGLYNKLVRLRQNVRESWSAIDTELRRRYDLIPNLVETVKGYAGHEKETLERVIAARNAAAGNHGTPAEQAVTENQLSGALRQLFALSEAYPDLKANQGFNQLQAQLEETENRLGQSRRFYNANVRELNTATETFPSVLIANSMGFKREAYFESEENARGPVAVQF
ncbi:LemA protein [Abditibacterium utsteinense]|uniref:LemA protein n=1 Tax=Abditibacterium utsteinense TaxID=1960156 RepID=A0A2S8ST48_9BACT|nr:LemA family protein [Abditibacterium utsteinense]PQV63984.1 LemA protein [Abditibacterium utsteinense]